MSHQGLRNREEFEAEELARLAAYACNSKHSLGRRYQEEEHPYRTCFQRDRDRIIHCKAFRRLEYKTQVFVNHEGDHYRTRLTHSLEVAQISRTIARTLRVNEDLSEAIALAHDLGHPPFGHSGEKAMNELMKDAGGFEHNRQSFRIVTHLEKRDPRYLGLNLTLEVLEGLSKHFTEYDLPDGREFTRTHEPSIEAQIANFSDEIAYNNHDLDDGLRSNLISLEQLKEVELWQTTYSEMAAKRPGATLEILRIQTIRNIINQLVTDLVKTTLENLEAKKIKNLEDVYAKGKNLVGYSEPIKRQNAELKRFLFTKLYRHYRVERMAEKAERILRDLFLAFLKNPKIMPDDFDSGQAYDLPRHICDYIAGMTDRYALEEHQKLFNPESRV